MALVLVWWWHGIGRRLGKYVVARQQADNQEQVIAAAQGMSILCWHIWQAALTAFRRHARCAGSIMMLRCWPRMLRAGVPAVPMHSCAGCNMRCALCNAHCAGCDVRCALCNAHCAECNVRCALCNARCAGNDVLAPQQLHSGHVCA